jgi:hypothetical protein
MNVWELGDLERFDTLVCDIGQALLAAPRVDVGSWQSQDVSGRPEMVSYELMHVRLEIMIATIYQPKLAICTGANLPWAEDHFQERVCGQPLNPPPSEAYWPFAVNGNAAHKADEKFSHTYPERFWPKYTNGQGIPLFGIRYQYGDLRDIVRQLAKSPLTRQAYLPVWFPEDTGAVHGERVPCTLGYQFLVRNGLMDIEYHIRSCDFMRHWRDDVYMAGRLLQWVCEEVNTRLSPTIKPHKLVMNIGSFHIFDGDRPMLKQQTFNLKRKLDEAKYASIAGAL